MWLARLPATPVSEFLRAFRNAFKQSRRWPRVALVPLLACFLFQVRVDAQVQQSRLVLLLTDLGTPASPGFTEIESAVFNELQKSPYKIEFYSDSLEVTMFPDEGAQLLAGEEFLRKYSGRKPDVIVAAGPASLKFIAGMHERFFADTPVVFCGITEDPREMLKLDRHFTGVRSEPKPEATLSAALHLLPQTKRVVVVGGMGKFDRQWEAIAKRGFLNYETKLDFMYLTDLAMPTLLGQLRNLPSDTIVFHTSISQDAAGERFIDSAQSVPLVVGAANAPIFVMDDVDFRAGAVGGDLVDWADNGRVAADMVVRILNGEKAQNIQIAISPDVYTFNWIAMQRWGLKEKNLPPGSIVVNRPAGFWYLYKRYVLVGIFVILAQMLAIIALLWQRSERRKTQVALVHANEQLRLAVEAGKCVAWDLDLKSGRTRWFGNLPTMFGMNSEIFVGQAEDFYRYIHPADRERVLDALRKSRQKHEPYYAEFRLLLPDGTIRWVDDRGEHEYAKNGEPERTTGMAVDITERKHADDALKQSEQKFSSVFHQSPLAISIKSVEDQQYVEVNETYEHLTGWRRHEVIGRTPTDIALWVDPVQREALMESLRAAGFVRNYEAHVRKKDGQIRAILGSAEIIECNGESCMLSVFADVTDLKQAEEAERASESRFRQFFDTLPEYCFMTSASGEILDANPAACKALGYAREELIGKPLSTIYALGSLSKVVDLLEKWQRTGTLHDEEMAILTKGGQTRTVLLNAGSVKDTNGNLLYSTTVMVDVTERQQAEAALRESEERFRLVANAAPVMIWMSGSDKLCNYFNQPWLMFTGRSIHEELGNGWAEGVHPDDLEGCMKTYVNAFDQREPFEMEYRLRRNDGDYRWIFDHGVPRFNPDGSFTGYIGSCLDVTDRRLAEAALSGMSRKLIEAQEQERTRIARELHDDINQRVALVSVNLERLQRDLSSSAPGAGWRFDELRDQLSDLGRDIQALSHQLHSSKLEYLGLVTAAASFCKELSEEHGVKVEFHSENIPKHLPWETALCFYRVLQESLQNGLKHSGSKHFEVWLKGTPSEIELTVRDSGVGFDPEEAVRGHGLGLTSMQERLKLVDGKLSFDSHPGQGTVIRATAALNIGTKAAHAGA